MYGPHPGGYRKNSCRHVVKTENSNSRRAGILIRLGIILIAASVIVLFTPFAARYINRISTEEFIHRYTAPAENPAAYDEMRSMADTYNRKIAEDQRQTGFIYRDTYEDPEYDSLLAGPAGIMCLVEIPKIHVFLPVGHGTGTKLLSECAGHLHGTSLPTGGPSNHAVIAAHAGMSDRELFTYLPQLRIGDEFFIYVLGEKHTYKVDKITEVFPSETELLSVVRDKDYITLMTCVPYGINTRRLFVRGVRHEPPVRVIT